MKKALIFPVLLLIILSLIATACSSSEKNIIGTVDEVTYTKIALSQQLVTLLVVTDEDGNKHYVGMLVVTDEDGNKHYVGMDEYTVFKEGQRIKIYYKENIDFAIAAGNYIEKIVQKDGSIKYEGGDRWWYQMLEYEILP